MKEFVCWEVKTFDTLSNDALYAILKLRSAIFVVEQKCLFEDMDGLDKNALHVMGFIQHELVAYCRIFGPGIAYKEGSIGRVSTRQSVRGKHYGRCLMDKAIEVYDREFPGIPNKIMAQLYLKNFYESYGYRAVSEVFVEDDIEHVYMIRT